MKLKSLLASLLALAPLASPAFYNLDSLFRNMDFRATLDYESEFVRRGSKLAKHTVLPSAELAYTEGCGKWYVGIWAAFPESQFNQAKQAVPYLGSAYDITDIFTIDLGYSYYWFPDARQNNPYSFLNHNTNRQHEVYLGLTADITFRPALYVFYNFSLCQFVVEPSVAHSIDLSCFLPCASIDVNLAIGWLHATKFNGDQRQDGVPRHKNSYFYANGKLDLSYNITPCLSISAGPRLSYNNDGLTATDFSPTGSYTANALGNHHTLFWGGANLTLCY